MWELLVSGGQVVDGGGSPPLRADVAVEGGRIAAVAPSLTGEANRVIDATGLVVAPGFIDIHTHADIALLTRPTHEPKVMQGVTTEVFSNCGLGFAPVTSKEALATQRAYLKGLFGDDQGVRWDWRGVGEFLEGMRGRIGTNALYLIPHGAVRVSVMGMAERPATRDELDSMLRMVEQGMDEGARGMSSGLWYAPMSYGGPEEPIELAGWWPLAAASGRFTCGSTAMGCWARWRR